MSAAGAESKPTSPMQPAEAAAEEPGNYLTGIKENVARRIRHVYSPVSLSNPLDESV